MASNSLWRCKTEGNRTSVRRQDNDTRPQAHMTLPRLKYDRLYIRVKQAIADAMTCIIHGLIYSSILGLEAIQRR